MFTRYLKYTRDVDTKENRREERICNNKHWKVLDIQIDGKLEKSWNIFMRTYCKQVNLCVFFL